MALLAVISSPVIAVLVLLAEGVGMIVFEVVFITLLQRATPEAALARVYGLQDSVTAVAQLLGSLAVPILVATTNLEWTLVIGGAAVLAASAVFAAPLIALADRVDVARRRHAPTVERLRRLGFLGDAPHAALERMARASRTVPVASGAEVFRQGDVPDDLYVIVSGTASVVTADGDVARLGIDDWFGEVGLVRRAPRNATVVAVEPLELLAIPGSVFLDALAHSEQLPDPLRLTMSARVGASRPDDSATLST